MPNYRYNISDLRAFARSNGALFFSRPRGGYWNALVTDGSVKNFSLVSQNPTVIAHGDRRFTVTHDYIEIFIPDAEVASFDNRAPPIVTIGFKLSVFLGTFGLAPSIHKMFVLARRKAWQGGVLVPVDRKVRDTDTLSSFPAYIVEEYPYVRRIVVFVFRNPRITSAAVTSAMAEILGIGRGDVADNLRKARTDGYIAEIEYEYYVESAWPVVATAEALGQDGELSLTELRTLLSKHMSFGRAVVATNAARDSGWIERRRVGKLMRVFVTDAGRQAAAKVPKPKTRHGLVATKAGRELVFRKEA